MVRLHGAIISNDDYRQPRAARQVDENPAATRTDNETTVNESPLAPPAVPWAAAALDLGFSQENRPVAITVCAVGGSLFCHAIS